MSSNILESASANTTDLNRILEDESDRRILIVDDEELIRSVFSEYLSDRYLCSTVADVKETLALLTAEPYALVITDLTMPGQSGVDLLGEVIEQFPDTAVIMVSGEDSARKALDAVQLGAFDYLIKPCDLDALVHCVERALEKRKLLRDGKRYKKELERRIEELALRKQAEAALRKSEERFKLVTHATSDAIWDWDLLTNLLWRNEGFQKMFGCYAEESEIGLETWARRLHPDDRERVVKGIHEVIDNSLQAWSDEYRFQRSDGSYALVIDRGYVVRNDEGKPVRMLGSMMDVTEYKNLEGQLRQAQKLESIGQLAAGIAHEINTPLQYVGDNTCFLQDAFHSLIKTMGKFDELLVSARAGNVAPQLIKEIGAQVKEADVEYLAEEIPKAIQQSLDGVERVTKIVQSMKDFAHPGSTEKKAVDLNKAIESTITVASNEWKYVAEVRTDFDSTLPPVPCLLGEFNQVILNMIVNAAHAITDVLGDNSQDKGTITISTRRDGEWAEVRINDTGAGIPAELRSKIFDPFFTTKRVGKGTGQGLAISHRVVVEKHCGALTFETEMGRGTTFIIRLPLSEQASSKNPGKHE